ANAPVYENYTDVCGVKTINPKLIPDAKTIKKISYKDMEIMSNYDAKVLHSSVCKILKNTKIKTIIKNIFNLSGEKTIIDNKNHKNNFICYKKRKNEIEIIIKNNQKTNKKLVTDADFEQKIQEIYQKWSKNEKN
ncbi:MAG: hypothetical protein IJ817_00795, partial [Clostridia bacterium]|nr:hypothetical protein [Clostridia bacterium]